MPTRTPKWWQFPLCAGVHWQLPVSLSDPARTGSIQGTGNLWLLLVRSPPTGFPALKPHIPTREGCVASEVRPVASGQRRVAITWLIRHVDKTHKQANSEGTRPYLIR